MAALAGHTKVYVSEVSIIPIGPYLGLSIGHGAGPTAQAIGRNVA